MVSKMLHKFTEQDTETFYDSEDAVYRSFWDEQGSLHWGFFDSTTGLDFLKACSRLNDMMIEKAQINSEARVLDLGCGNGTTAMWLSRATGCRVVGIDLSGTRIGNAERALQEQPIELRSRLGFEKASATELPFPDGSFTHVWSQATIYHVHEKEKALSESYRILDSGGVLIFDDLIKPRSDISEAAKTYVYDRLLFDTNFSFDSYQVALAKAGFSVLEAIDLSPHLKKSYQCLAALTRAKGDGQHGKYMNLTYAYEQMEQALDNEELGWGLYLCRK